MSEWSWESHQSNAFLSLFFNENELLYDSYTMLYTLDTSNFKIPNVVVERCFDAESFAGDLARLGGGNPPPGSVPDPRTAYRTETGRVPNVFHWHAFARHGLFPSATLESSNALSPASPADDPLCSGVRLYLYSLPAVSRSGGAHAGGACSQARSSSMLTCSMATV